MTAMNPTTLTIFTHASCSIQPCDCFDCLVDQCELCGTYCNREDLDGPNHCSDCKPVSIEPGSCTIFNAHPTGFDIRITTSAAPEPYFMNPSEYDEMVELTDSPKHMTHDEYWESFEEIHYPIYIAPGDVLIFEVGSDTLIKPELLFINVLPEITDGDVPF